MVTDEFELTGCKQLTSYCFGVFCIELTTKSLIVVKVWFVIDVSILLKLISKLKPV